MRVSCFVGETDFDFVVHHSQSVSSATVISVDIVVDGKIVNTYSDLMQLFKHAFHII